MDKDFLVKLCLAVYKVSELFPEKESLKFFLRKKANQILADSILFSGKNPVSLTKEQEKRLSDQIIINIEVLQGYFEVAESQNWVKKENFLVLKKEYDKIEKEVKEAHSTRDLKEPQPNSSGQAHSTSSGQAHSTSSGQEKPLQISLDKIKKGRYKKILEILGEKKEAQVRDLKEIFPQISKRTLRRDFDYLLRKGLVERIGDKNRTLYKLNRVLDRTKNLDRTEKLEIGQN